MISSKYRTDLTKKFRDSFDTNEFYLFVSDIEEGAVSNTKFSINDFLEKTIFGKKIEKSEVFYAVQNIIWQGGDVYDQYDDKTDLVDKKFYAIVYPSNNDTGDYRVFKCLFNNYGGESLVPPNYDAGNVDQIYRTSDGYVWKHMFAISEVDFDRYITLGLIPIIHESVDNANAIVEDASSIDQIFIENPNTNAGYESVDVRINQSSGGTVVITRVSISESGTETVVTPSGSLSEIANFYTGRYFYATNADKSSGLYEITSYTYDPVTRTGRIRLKDFTSDSIVVSQSTAKILPKVVINGDGTGAVALPIVDGSRIERILMIESGSGYTNVSAHVVDPFGFNPNSLNSTEERAILRPVLSPKGGHSSNPVEELNTRRLLLYTGITLEDNLTFSTSNQYTKVGIVKNPSFNANTSPSVFDNRIAVDLSSSEGLSINETVTQSISGEVTFQAKVHEIANTVVYLTDYHGPYQNYANTDVSINPSLPLVSSRGQLISINNVTISDYAQKSGDVYYAVDFDPVIRTTDSREEYKIILEF